MKFIFLVCLIFGFAGMNAQKSGKTVGALEFQKKLNWDFKKADKTPLTAKDRERFQSLEFFPIDTTLVVTADFVRTPYESPFEMPTTTDRKPMYLKYGELYFSLQGKEQKLNVYQNLELVKKPEYKDYLFLPFTDKTNGFTSYSGGRYIDLRIPRGNRITLDFNKSYNPYCAYNGSYSCPIPPAENHLDLNIEAGVKDFIKP